MGCSGIKRIDLSHTRVAEIGAYAFCGCTSLTGVIFPDTLVRVGESCFQRCAAITAVNLSTTKLATLADGMFGGCTSLVRQSHIMPMNPCVVQMRPVS